jgi:hypothetical protein
MPQVHHVKKARKNNKAAGVKKGQPYWWANCWSGYRKAKSVWTSPPSQTQLDAIDYDLEMVAIMQEMYAAKPKDASELEDMRDEWVDYLRVLADECRQKFDDLADDLQQGPDGKLLEDRADDLDQWAVEVEAIELDSDGNEHAGEGVNWAEHGLELIDEMAIYCPV